jgi:hypothetical protein
MKRDGLKGLLQIGFFLTGLSICSILYQPRDSAEFVVSFCSLGLGLFVLLIAAAFIYMLR